MAKTFLGAKRMPTTSKGGPPLSDVHRRIVRCLKSGSVIDDCVIDDTADSVLERALPMETDLRVELILRGAKRMYEMIGADVSEVYSQPRVTQEAAVRLHGGMQLTPGWIWT